jgi:hypothetical protein
MKIYKSRGIYISVLPSEAGKYFINIWTDSRRNVKLGDRFTSFLYLCKKTWLTTSDVNPF